MIGDRPRDGRPVGRLWLWLWLGLGALMICVLAIQRPMLGGDMPGGKADRGTEVPSALPTPPARPGAALPVEPEIVTWGGYGDQLALVIKNSGDREIRSARLLITALGANRVPIATTTGSEDTTCCTVVSLRPGAEFGIFIDLPGPVADVEDVVVRYLDLETVPAGPDDAAWVEVSAPRLTRSADDAVVTVRLEAHGDVGAFVAGQAFLVDSRDRLVGVISGRFYCFTRDRPRTVRMQLKGPVPSGTRISKVLALPIADGTPIGIRHACP
ncbi:hypothetical protein BJ980_001472 [Nocardioides daedukensis]|uniref:Uncharacterized protein n=1 Tax=Nocardioides daedukensis TaxID=634462 RepID=A0A7Y9S070_9ACTN|nr:hypothetical protein [Nocardioides daedukensis]NYG58549.1 hypothetical protein [Nocardioides daedukensis]